ncbi:hypothetical protein GCM10012284_00680 [Mangrovihabitans endophyticus]|uniref:Uncharacterized protein n=1 Tax=Mangrovihabitans endophyticus TaxID=1751298 RepID=A0A8J3FLQ0_9ACTN|nr:hypothetical protein GCM10012284_00680 [Mangrovihabitans endophyticus]
MLVRWQPAGRRDGGTVRVETAAGIKASGVRTALIKTMLIKTALIKTTRIKTTRVEAPRIQAPLVIAALVVPALIHTALIHTALVVAAGVIRPGALIQGGALVQRVGRAALQRTRGRATRVGRLLVGGRTIGRLVSAARPVPRPVEQRPPARGWFRRPAPAGLGPLHGASSLLSARRSAPRARVPGNRLRR